LGHLPSAHFSLARLTPLVGRYAGPISLRSQRNCLRALVLADWWGRTADSSSSTNSAYLLRGIRTAQTAWPGSPGRCSRSDPAAYMAAATPVSIVTGLQPAPVPRARRLGSGQELKDPASTTRRWWVCCDAGASDRVGEHRGNLGAPVEFLAAVLADTVEAVVLRVTNPSENLLPPVRSLSSVPLQTEPCFQAIGFEIRTRARLLRGGHPWRRRKGSSAPSPCVSSGRIAGDRWLVDERTRLSEGIPLQPSRS
jgi:hypothetical protein